MRFKTQEEIEQEIQAARKYKPTKLPLEKLLLAYGRQSTKDQVIHNKESARQQAIELLDYGRELGWPDDLRLLFIENQLTDGTIKNASGRLRIDEREGLSEVYTLIKQGIVGAILVRKIDRLFRDEDMVEPAIFARECKKHHVLIITLDGDIFDFNSRPGDTERFLKEEQEAANYLKHIRMMADFRNKKGLRGEFNGHAVATGLMLNEERTSYVANPIWAPTMKQLLKRYRELDGNFAQLRREVVGKPIFKDLPEDILKRIGRVCLLKVPGGYTVKTHDGLRDIMTHVELIGHTAYNGHLIKNTHKAIVDEGDFWYAFYRLSKYDTDGHLIEREKSTVRYSREPEEALFQGVRASGKAVITSPGQSVYAHQGIKSSPAAYRIMLYHPHDFPQAVASIGVSYLDAIFTERLLARLDEHKESYILLQKLVTKEYEGIDWASVSPKLWAQFQPGFEEQLAQEAQSPYFQLLAMQQEPVAQLTSVDDDIEETKRTIARLERDYKVNFDLMTDKELRENRESRIRLAKKLTDLERKQAEENATLEDMRDVGELLQDAYTVWSEWKMEKKQRFVRLVTESIILKEITEDWFTLTITWAPFLMIQEIDMAYIWRQNGGTASAWTEEEDQIIRDYYGTASKKWLLEQLPKRSWRAIVTHSNRKGVDEDATLRRHRQVSDTDLPDWMCLEDKQVMDEHGLVLDTPERRVWWVSIALTNPYPLSG
jgi:DNA invertase Pin-like site-specific DNA recombinase